MPCSAVFYNPPLYSSMHHQTPVLLLNNHIELHVPRTDVIIPTHGLPSVLFGFLTRSLGRGGSGRAATLVAPAGFGGGIATGDTEHGVRTSSERRWCGMAMDCDWTSKILGGRRNARRGGHGRITCRRITPQHHCLHQNTHRDKHAQKHDDGRLRTARRIISNRGDISIAPRSVSGSQPSKWPTHLHLHRRRSRSNRDQLPSRQHGRSPTRPSSSLARSRSLRPTAHGSANRTRRLPAMESSARCGSATSCAPSPTRRPTPRIPRRIAQRSRQGR